MSRKYYYLVASLPSIYFSSKPPLSSEEFRKRCEEQLSPEDFQLIDQALNDQFWEMKTSNLIFKQWLQLNHFLRNEIAYVRARRAGKNLTDHLRGERAADSLYAEMVLQASKAPDPLTGERIFDGHRWQFLEDAGRFHYFDLDWLIVYALKLRILERYTLVESEQGREVFKEYKNIKISLN